MAQLGGSFDASGVAPKQDFELLPPGDYPVMIVKSDMVPTKDGTGQRLTLELDVIDGPMKGRKLFDGLNLVNKSEKAVEIAERTLSAICHAVGVLNVSDSEQLHGRAMLAVVKVRPAEGAYGPKNEIATYKPTTAGVAAPATTTAVAAPTPAAKTTGSAPPWRKAG
jgi:hypothetical protein